MEGSLGLDQLAASFVTQYYEGLLLQPKSLAACYGPDSTMVVSYASGASTEAQGPEEVGARLLTLSGDFPESKKLQVLHTEIYPSFENSSLIIVEGVVLSAESSQEFTHTVILRNNGQEGEFYIRNDIWRFSEDRSNVQAVAQVPAAQVPEAVEVEQVEEAQEVPHAEQNGHQEEDDTPEEEAQDEESMVEESTKSEMSISNADAVSSRMNESVTSKQSATPSEADEAPAKTPPKAEEPKGPINWAARAAAARAAPANSGSAPQRVSPPPPRKKEDPKKVPGTKKEAEPVNAEKKAENNAHPKRPEGRQYAKSFLVVKVRDAEDDEVRAGIPAALVSGLVSIRNMSFENSRVFLDFTQANALELMKDPTLRIAGKTFTVEPQKKR